MKIILTILLFISSLFPEVKVGENFPTLKLIDQFDHKVDFSQESNATLLLSFEKDVSKNINYFLKAQDKDFMSGHKVHYISDISSMPSLITKWVALPKMKKLPFKIALVYEEKVADIIQREEGKITVITLNNNHITSVKFLESEKLITLFQ